MWVQAICLALACAIVGFTPAHLVALVLALLLAGHWLVMSATYAAALDGRRRSAGEDGGPDRQRMDRRVRRQAVFAVAVGLLAGIAGGKLGDLWLWHDRKLLTVCFGALAALAWTVYASSLVDWYYVRPCVDGIVREPPCRTSGDEDWGNITRLWYLHRGLAEFLGLLAVIVAFSSLVGALIAGTGTLPTAAAVAIPSSAATALVLLTQAAIATLRHRAVSRPAIWVGDVLIDGDWRAYVLEVTVRSVIVREWDFERACWGRQNEVTHARLDEDRLAHRRFAGCETCAKVNPACDRPTTDHDARLPPRRLVW